jgi:hypothetical protein
VLPSAAAAFAGNTMVWAERIETRHAASVPGITRGSMVFLRGRN